MKDLGQKVLWKDFPNSAHTPFKNPDHSLLTQILEMLIFNISLYICQSSDLHASEFCLGKAVAELSGPQLTFPLLTHTDIPLVNCNYG